VVHEPGLRVAACDRHLDRVDNEVGLQVGSSILHISEVE